MTLFLVYMGVTATLSNIPAGVYAVLGTIIGTVGLKSLEKWLNRNKDKNEFRRDLHAEIKDLQVRLDLVEEEVSEWRQRAYDAEETVAKLRIILIKYGEDLELFEKKHGTEAQ